MKKSEKSNIRIPEAGSFGRYMLAAFFAVFALISYTEPSFAGPTVNDVAKNMVKGTENLPGFVSALAYLLGILLGILGILKLKDHVENPAQTPLRIGVIRLLIGGALFALPIIYQAAFVTFNGAGPSAALDFDNFTISQTVSKIMGTIANFIPWPNINSILANIINSIEEIPGLISAAAYLLGLLLGLSGILKLREHVENPDQVTLKEPVIRLLTAGALFALPTIYNAMYDVAGGNTGIGALGSIRDFLGTLGFFVSPYGAGIMDCDPVTALLGPTMGNSICGIFIHTAAFPAFLTACAYVIGLVFGLWGIFKIKAHVQNPQQVALWEGVSRFIAGGFFFALPVIIEVARATLVPLSVDGAGVAALILLKATGYNDSGIGSCGGPLGGGGPMGLDGVITCFMRDLTGPIHVVLNFFAFCAGIIFLMIGVSRLIRSAQDGARGPGGIGTIMTFATGAALISYNQLIHAFTASLFTNPFNKVYATMQYTAGMCAGGGATCAEIDAAHAVISAIIKFVLIVGLLSFVRGIFIIRSVAEGNSQSSIMSGVTHMVAGALAVNLGPLLNAVQATLGVGGFGIAFT